MQGNQPLHGGKKAWSKREPNNMGNEDFGQLMPDGKMNDLPHNWAIPGYCRGPAHVNRIITHPVSVTAKVGDPVTFSVDAESDPFPDQVYWRKNGSPIANTFSETLSFTSVTEQDEGEYDIYIKSCFKTVYSNKATLTIWDVPTIAVQPTDPSPTPAPGDQIALRVVLGAGQSPQYRWYHDGTPIAGGAGASASLALSITTASAGTYKVVIETNGGTITSNNVQVNVREPVFLSSSPESVSHHPGETAVFTVMSSKGELPINFQWYVKGTPVSGGTLISGGKGSRYEVSQVSEADEGTYFCIATNLGGAGIAQSDSAQLIVTQAPGAPISSMTCEKNGVTALDLTWQPPSDDGGRTVTSYNLFRNNGGNSNVCEKFVENISTLSYTVSNLQSGTPYRFCVSALNLNGEGARSGATAACSTYPAADHLVYVVQPIANVLDGDIYTQMPVLEIRDVHGDVVTTGPHSLLTVSLTQTSGPGIFDGQKTASALLGQAAPYFGLNTEFGSSNAIVITASVAVPALSVDSNPITVFARAKSLVFSTNPKGNVLQREMLSAMPTVDVLDLNQNVVLTGPHSAIGIRIDPVPERKNPFVASSIVTATTVGGTTGSELSAIGMRYHATQIQFRASTTSQVVLSVTSLAFEIFATSASFAFHTQPEANVFTGLTFATLPRVQLLDDGGVAIKRGPHSTVDVVLTLNKNEPSLIGDLEGATTVALSQGVTGNFAGLTVNHALTTIYATLTATVVTSHALEGTTSYPITSDVIVVYARAAHLAFAREPVIDVLPRVNFAVMPIVEVRDSFDRLIDVGPHSDISPITLTLNDPVGAGLDLEGNQVVSAGGGVYGPFTGLYIDETAWDAPTTLRNVTLTASADLCTGGQCSNVVSQVLTLYAAARSLVYVRQPDGGDVYIHPLPVQPVVAILDHAGTVIVDGPDSLLTISLTLGGGEGGLGGTFVDDALNGVADGFTGIFTSHASYEYYLNATTVSSVPDSRELLVKSQLFVVYHYAVGLAAAAEPIGNIENAPFYTPLTIVVYDEFGDAVVDGPHSNITANVTLLDADGTDVSHLLVNPYGLPEVNVTEADRVAMVAGMHEFSHLAVSRQGRDYRLRVELPYPAYTLTTAAFRTYREPTFTFSAQLLNSFIDSGLSTAAGFMQINTTEDVQYAEIEMTRPDMFFVQPYFTWNFTDPRPTVGDLVLASSFVRGTVYVDVRLRFGQLYLTKPQPLGLRVRSDFDPRVDSLDLNNGPSCGGVLVDLYGAFLGRAPVNLTALDVGNKPCEVRNWVSDTHVQCTTSVGVTTGPVYVETTSGELTTTFNYTVNPAPRIDAFEPATAPAVEPTIITISGANLGRSRDDIVAVIVGGTPCSIRTATPTRISCRTSASVYAGSGGVEVVTKSGCLGTSASNPELPLFDFSGPKVLRVTPSVLSSRGGETITAVGIKLGVDADDLTEVQILNQPCEDLEWVSETSFSCVTPTFVTDGDSTLTVSTSSYGESDTGFVRVRYPGLKIDRFFPPRGPVSGIFDITIEGGDFGLPRFGEIEFVSVAGVPCERHDVLDASTIVCLANASPDGSELSGPVVIRSVFGVEAVTEDEFGYIASESALTPVIIECTPTVGSFRGGDVVQLIGQFFGRFGRDVLSVTFNGKPCSSIEWVDTAQIFCTTPPGEIGAPVEIEMETQEGGLSVNFARFEYYYPPPEMHDFFPREGLLDGGTSVTVLGANFGIPSGRADYEYPVVMIADAPCATEYVDESTLVCVTPRENLVSRLQPREVTVVLGDIGETVGPTDRGEFEYLSRSQLCDPPCGREGSCVRLAGERAVCDCFATWAGPPLCNQSAVELEYVGDFLTEEDSAKGRADMLRVRVNRPLSASLVVSLFVNDTTEAELGGQFAAFDVDDVDAATGVGEVMLPIWGRDDGVRDGMQYVSVFAALSTTDGRFGDGRWAPEPVVVPVRDSAPVILEILPLLSPLNGTNITVIGYNFDSDVRVSLAGQMIEGVQMQQSDRRIGSGVSAMLPLRLLQDGGANATDGGESGSGSGSTFGSGSTSGSGSATTESDTEPDTDTDTGTGTDTGSNVGVPGVTSVVELHFRSVSVGQGGYENLDVINRDGAFARDGSFFYTDDCPEEGQFGRGSDCVDCPEGGICPGGYRIWPKPGYWNPDESSGYVYKCDPAERCLGGPNSECGPGYKGDYCGQCADDFFPMNGGCEACPSYEGKLIYLACDVFVWIIVSMAIWWIEERENLAHVIALVLQLQQIGGVGRLIPISMPFLLRSVYDFLYLFAGDFQFLRPQCQEGAINFNLNFLLRVAYNLAIAVPILSGIVVTKWFSMLWHRGDGPEAVQLRREHYQDRFVRAMTIHLMIIYMSLTSSAIEAVACIRLGDGEWRMITEPNHVCYADNHVIIVGASVVLFLLISVGFPVFMYRKQKRNASRLYTDHRFQERWDFLYEPFVRKFPFLWILEFCLLISLALGDTVLINHPRLQFLFIGSMLFGILLMVLIKRPYRRGFENGVAFCVAGANLATIFIVFSTRTDMISAQFVKYASWTLLFLLFIVISILSSVVVYFVFVRWTNKRLYWWEDDGSASYDFGLGSDEGEEQGVVESAVDGFLSVFGLGKKSRSEQAAANANGEGDDDLMSTMSAWLGFTADEDGERSRFAKYMGSLFGDEDNPEVYEYDYYTGSSDEERQRALTEHDAELYSYYSDEEGPGGAVAGPVAGGGSAAGSPTGGSGGASLSPPASPTSPQTPASPVLTADDASSSASTSVPATSIAMSSSASISDFSDLSEASA